MSYRRKQISHRNKVYMLSFISFAVSLFTVPAELSATTFSCSGLYPNATKNPSVDCFLDASGFSVFTFANMVCNLFLNSCSVPPIKNYVILISNLHRFCILRYTTFATNEPPGDSTFSANVNADSHNSMLLA